MSSPDKLFRLDGKVAILTGASRGIGEAIAVAFAQQGAKVVLASRKLPDLQAVAERITQAGGTAPRRLPHRQARGYLRPGRGRQSAFGGVDILVNNAATNPYFGPLIDTPDSAFDKTFEVNVKATSSLPAR